MATWKGTVGKGFDREGFREYVLGLKFGKWRPQFVVLHNTASPTLAQWHQVAGETRMKNLASYYKGKGWSAGPHLFVADDLIWVFTRLTTSGVHSPSWNNRSWGVEMVGDFSKEPFDSGAGALVRDNAVEALAVLHAVAGLDPGTLRFHKEDPKTTHNCPGKLVDKAAMIHRVRERLAEMKRLKLIG